MSPETSGHLIWLTLELSEARAQAHSYRELWLMTLGLFGDSQREVRRLEAVRASLAARHRTA